MSVGLRQGGGQRGRLVAGVLIVLYLAVAAAIVFDPTAAVPTRSTLWIVEHLGHMDAPPWIVADRVELVTNVLLFVPLTFLGSFLLPRWSWVTWTVLGLVASLLIELTQYEFMSARSAQLTDIATNTLGALLGAWVAVPFRMRMRRRRSRRTHEGGT